MMDEKGKRWVVVTNRGTDGVFCRGVFKRYRTALGEVMDDIFDFQSNYQNDGDIFLVGTPYQMEGEGGECIEVTYKAMCWEKECKDEYYILKMLGDDE